MTTNNSGDDGFPPNTNYSKAYTPGQSFAIYTVFHMFLQMRDQLGLEAALTFAQKYIQVMDKQDPRLKQIIGLVSKNINVKTLYQQVCHEKHINP